MTICKRILRWTGLLPFSSMTYIYITANSRKRGRELPKRKRGREAERAMQTRS